ncbi:MAG: hypothetical protein R3255_07285 [Candidatus Lokiarchaeia archaeon]|nr:hypothetical protein [Candidatus Lokiarchaeia archaeon]
MSDLKDKIEEKVEDIVYKKAKEEIKFTLKSYLESLVAKAFSFFGWEESQEQKIKRISKEIKEKEDIRMDDSVVGMVELFTLTYIQTMANLLSFSVSDEPEEIEEEKNKI